MDVYRTLVNCKLTYIPDEVRALAGLEQLCVLSFVHITILMYQQAMLLTNYCVCALLIGTSRTTKSPLQTAR